MPADGAKAISGTRSSEETTWRVFADSISWWRRVKHPLYPDIKDAMAFVDACEAALKRSKGKPSDELEALQTRQWEELQSLVEWTVKRSDETGGQQAL